MQRSAAKAQNKAAKKQTSKTTKQSRRRITTKSKKSQVKTVKTALTTSLNSTPVTLAKRGFEIPKQKRPKIQWQNGEYSRDYVIEPSDAGTPMFHANVNPDRQREYWDYSAFIPAYGNEENYEISEKLTDGKNSVVMAGYAVNSNVKLSIKTMMPIAATKIKRQALALTNLKNLPHVQNLLDICLDRESRVTSFVTMFSPHAPFDSFKNDLTVEEITSMAFQMMDGLDSIHSEGIIHRNIHPGNVLMNPKGPKKEVCIVDFDNCEFFHPGTAYATKDITKRGWLSPEMALGMADYHYAHDVWGAGMILAQMMYPKEQMFQIQEGQSDIDFIARIVGSGAIATLIEEQNLHEVIDPETVLPALQAKYPPVDFKKLKSPVAAAGLVDLLERLLVADFGQRISPFESTCLNIFAPLHDDYDPSKPYDYDPTAVATGLPVWNDDDSEQGPETPADQAMARGGMPISWKPGAKKPAAAANAQAQAATAPQQQFQQRPPQQQFQQRPPQQQFQQRPLQQQRPPQPPKPATTE